MPSRERERTATTPLLCRAVRRLSHLIATLPSSRLSTQGEERNAAVSGRRYTSFAWNAHARETSLQSLRWIGFRSRPESRPDRYLQRVWSRTRPSSLLVARMGRLWIGYRLQLPAMEVSGPDSGLGQTNWDKPQRIPRRGGEMSDRSPPQT